MARDVNVKEAEQRGLYYYLSHYFKHIDFIAIMNHRCPGNLTGPKNWVLRFLESSSEDFVFRLLSLIFFGDLG